MKKDGRRPGKDAARRHHPGMEKMKTRMDTLRQLREKHYDEMLAIDKEFVASEDKIAELAKKEGLEYPETRMDFRRIRIAFPAEMKELDAKSKTMKPHEYFQAVKALSEKLGK